MKLSQITQLLCACSIVCAQGHDDANASLGLPQLDASRVTAVDLNDDHHADLVVRLNLRDPSRPLVFLWQVDPAAPLGGTFIAAAEDTLPVLSPRDVITFADLNNDGHADAIIARYLDYLQTDFVAPIDAPTRTAILPGRGDGTFAPAQTIAAAPAATTAAISSGSGVSAYTCSPVTGCTKPRLAACRAWRSRLRMVFIAASKSGPEPMALTPRWRP